MKDSKKNDKLYLKIGSLKSKQVRAVEDRSAVLSVMNPNPSDPTGRSLLFK